MSHPVRGPEVHVHRRPGAQYSAAFGQQLEPHIEARGWGECLRMREPVAPRERTLLHRGEIQRATLARASRTHCALLSVDAANAYRQLSGHHEHGVTHTHTAREYRAGRHGTLAWQREDPIH